MNILQLTIKKKWFDMIASGEKKEEYREMKKYWGDRLCNNGKQWLYGFKEFDAVLFINGYSPNSPRVLIECEGIDFGTGKPEWGAVEGVEYFVIKLGSQCGSGMTICGVNDCLDPNRHTPEDATGKVNDTNIN